MPKKGNYESSILRFLSGRIQGDDIGAVQLRLLAQEAVRRPGGVRPRNRQDGAAPRLQQHNRRIQGRVSLSSIICQVFCQVGDINIDPGCDLPRRPNGFTGLSDYSYPSDPIR